MPLESLSETSAPETGFDPTSARPVIEPPSHWDSDVAPMFTVLTSGSSVVVVLSCAKAVPEAVTVVVLGPSIELSYVGATQAKAAVGVRQS